MSRSDPTFQPGASSSSTRSEDIIPIKALIHAYVESDFDRQPELLYEEMELTKILVRSKLLGAPAIISGSYPEAYLGCGINSTTMSVTSNNPFQQNVIKDKTIKTKNTSLTFNFFCVDSVFDLNSKLNSNVNANAYLFGFTDMPTGFAQLHEETGNELYFGAVIKQVTSQELLDVVTVDNFKLNQQDPFEYLFYYGDFYVKKINFGQKIALIVKLSIKDSRYTEFVSQILKDSLGPLLELKSEGQQSLNEEIIFLKNRIQQVINDVNRGLDLAAWTKNNRATIVDWDIRCQSNISHLNRSFSEIKYFDTVFSELDNLLRSPNPPAIIELELYSVASLFENFQESYEQYIDFQNQVFAFLKQTKQLHCLMRWLLSLMSRQLNTDHESWIYWNDHEKMNTEKNIILKKLLSNPNVEASVIISEIETQKENQRDIANKLHRLFTTLNTKHFIQLNDPIALELANNSSSFPSGIDNRSSSFFSPIPRIKYVSINFGSIRSASTEKMQFLSKELLTESQHVSSQVTLKKLCEFYQSISELPPRVQKDIQQSKLPIISSTIPSILSITSASVGYGKDKVFLTETDDLLSINLFSHFLALLFFEPPGFFGRIFSTSGHVLFSDAEAAYKEETAPYWALKIINRSENIHIEKAFSWLNNLINVNDEITITNPYVNAAGLTIADENRASLNIELMARPSLFKVRPLLSLVPIAQVQQKKLVEAFPELVAQQEIYLREAVRASTI